MIKLHRNSCTFHLSPDNRIMLLEIRTILSCFDEEMEQSDIMNAALRSYLPSLLQALKSIKTDKELGMLYKSVLSLEAECHCDAAG
jgi:hypothetical protein